MKKITLFITLFFAFVSAGYAQFPAPYCGPITFTTGREPITLVNFAGINNTSPAPTGGVAHQDFVSISGAVTAGTSYPYVLKGNTDGGFTDYFAIFADWNQDGDFNDASESYAAGTIVGSTGLDAIQSTGSILVPATAITGTTRLRVVKKWNVLPDACNTGGTGYGEAEDYSLVVTGANCTPPTITFAVASLCPTLSFNVTVSITSLGSATSLSVTDNQDSVAQTVTAAGTLTFGPYTNGTDVVITAAHNLNSICNVVSAAFPENACVPGCVGNPVPANGATNLPYGPITLSWDVPTTGDPVESYDLYIGNTATDLEYFASYDTNTTGDDLNITAYSATVYWQIVAVNAGGESTGCPVWSFTTAPSPGFCLNGTLYPAATYTPVTCDGIFENVIATNAYAGEYTNVQLTSGQPYTFKSSVATDFITISTDAGVTAEVFGTTPLTWTSDFTGVARFYIHTSDQCGVQSTNRIRSIVCGTATADAPDYASLQFPATLTLGQGETGTVYGQVYEPNVTEPVGQGAGITASIGINTENTNPNTWTNFAPMTYNAAATTAGNNDEYLAQIGAGLAPGTYYYATRFRLNNGPFVYGGITTTGNGGIWDGTVYISGVLTVSPPPAPNNDLCANAQPLTVGGQFATNPVTGTTLGGTDTTGLPTFGCQTNRNSDVRYTAVVPASGTLTVETKAATGTGTLMTDSVVSVYTGTCGSLVEVGCNDDDGDLNFSLVSVTTGLTPGVTVYIGVWKYGTSAAGQFQVSAYDASLSTGDINRAGFNFYPNPVTSVLNLSHTSDIKTATVFNMLGQQVMVRNINASEAQLDMTSLPKGTYMVKLSANEGTKTIKIVKE